MEWKNNGPLPFLCFFLEVFANEHPLSLSFFFSFFSTSFWNCSTRNTSYYLSFILSIHRFSLVFFASCLEVFATKHPLSRLFFFIILMEKWSKERKKEISKKKKKKRKKEEKIRGVRWWTPPKMKWKKG